MIILLSVDSVRHLDIIIPYAERNISYTVLPFPSHIRIG